MLSWLPLSKVNGVAALSKRRRSSVWRPASLFCSVETDIKTLRDLALAKADESNKLRESALEKAYENSKQLIRHKASTKHISEKCIENLISDENPFQDADLDRVRLCLGSSLLLLTTSNLSSCHSRITLTGARGHSCRTRSLGPTSPNVSGPTRPGSARTVWGPTEARATVPGVAHFSALIGAAATAAATFAWRLYSESKRAKPRRDGGKNKDGGDGGKNKDEGDGDKKKDEGDGVAAERDGDLYGSGQYGGRPRWCPLGRISSRVRRRRGNTRAVAPRHAANLV